MKSIALGMLKFYQIVYFAVTTIMRMVRDPCVVALPHVLRILGLVVSKARLTGYRAVTSPVNRQAIQALWRFGHDGLPLNADR